MNLDRLQFALAHVTLRDGGNGASNKTIAILTQNCWPTFSNERRSLNALWWAASYGNAVIANGGRELSKMDRIRLRRKIGCDGELLSTYVAGMGSQGQNGVMEPAKYGPEDCAVGPPNVGYPYP